MKILAIAFTAVILTTATAAAHERAVSKSTLDGMGLPTMQPLSDDDGLAVRGKGSFAGVFGTSSANWGGQTSFNSYSAGSSWLGQGASAGGNTFSFGGNFQFSHFSW